MNHDHLLHGMSTILGKFVCFHHCSPHHHYHPPSLHTNHPPTQKHTRRSKIEQSIKIHSISNADPSTWQTWRVRLNDLYLRDKLYRILEWSWWHCWRMMFSESVPPVNAPHIIYFSQQCHCARPNAFTIFILCCMYALISINSLKHTSMNHPTIYHLFCSPFPWKAYKRTKQFAINAIQSIFLLLNRARDSLNQFTFSLKKTTHANRTNQQRPFVWTIQCSHPHTERK